MMRLGTQSLHLSFFRQGSLGNTRIASGVLFKSTELAHSMELGALVSPIRTEMWYPSRYHSKVSLLPPVRPQLHYSLIGTAIYIFFITPNQIQAGNFTTLMECNFTLDGQQRDTFQHVPDGSQDIQYDVLAFHMMDLPNIDHTVRFTTPVNSSVLLIFDYAIYTYASILDLDIFLSILFGLFLDLTTALTPLQLLPHLLPYFQV